MTPAPPGDASPASRLRRYVLASYSASMFEVRPGERLTNNYGDEKDQYVLASEADALLAAKDAELARLREALEEAEAQIIDDGWGPDEPVRKLIRAALPNNSVGDRPKAVERGGK